MARKKTSTGSSSEILLKAALRGVQEKKGDHLIYLDLRKIPGSVCDFFVICDAQSRTQVSAIADSVEEIIKKETNEKPWHTEGYQNAEWILVDYVNVVVHIFEQEARAFYNLEKLWADAEVHEVTKPV